MISTLRCHYVIFCSAGYVHFDKVVLEPWTGSRMTERTPLLHYRLVSVNDPEQPAPPARAAPERLPGPQRSTQPPKLSVLFGVVVPTLLSMFSVVVFLRIGE